MREFCRKKIWIFVLALLLAAALSRGLGLTHEMRNHPDEHVFVQGASSMAQEFLGTGEFSEVKPYPEGAYFFFAPFQVFSQLFGFDARVTNRVASVAYFSIAMLAGCALLRRISTPRAAGIFALLALFSLFHIEQSRYGTGESISFALLMLLLLCLWRYLSGEKNIWLWLSAILVGCLGAVKYPQIYFALLPLCAVFQKEKAAKVRAGLIFVGIAIVLGAFLLLSPGILADWRYLIDVSRRELKAYMLKGNVTEAGGPLNHLFSVLAYWLCYSDLLLAPVFAGIGLRACKRASETPARAFFGKVLPIVAGGFLLYNLFVTALFMRTLYPFFAVALIYASIGLDRSFAKSKLLPGLLLGLTILRACLYIGALAPENAAENLDKAIAQAQEIVQTDAITGLATDKYITGHRTVFAEKYPDAATISLKDLRENGFPDALTGVVVTGSLENGKAMPYLFPIADKEIQAFIDGWIAFRDENAPYLVGRSYPAAYAPLFGFWINGVVSEFDFPMNFVYALP